MRFKSSSYLTQDLRQSTLDFLTLEIISVNAFILFEENNKLVGCVVWRLECKHCCLKWKHMYKNTNVKYLMIKINSSFQHISKKIYYPIQVKVVVVETWFFMSTDIATISTWKNLSITKLWFDTSWNHWQVVKNELACFMFSKQFRKPMFVNIIWEH